MKNSIKSFLYIILLLILGAVVFNSDLIDTISDSLNFEETRNSVDSNTEIIKFGLVDGQKNPNLMNVQPASHLMSDLVFIPGSHDFGEVGISNDKTYNFQLRNDGTQTSGTVFLSGDPEFSCIAGCSYNLNPTQSQYVTLRFTPCELGEFDTAIYAGSAQATASGEGVPLDSCD